MQEKDRVIGYLQNKLDTLEDGPDNSKFQSIIKQTQLGLLRDLGSDKEIPTTKSIEIMFRKIKDSLDNEVKDEIDDGIASADAIIAGLAVGEDGYNTAKSQAQTKKSNFEAMEKKRIDRLAEYTSLENEIKQFDYDKDKKISHEIDLSATPRVAYILDGETEMLRAGIPGAIAPRYSLWTTDNQEKFTALKPGTVANEYIYHNSGIDYKISNLIINLATGSINFTDIDITPPNKLPFLKLTLKTEKEIWDLKLVKTRPVEINIKGLALNSKPDRENAFNQANTGDLLKNQFFTLATNHHKTLENEVFSELFEENGQFGWITLDDKQKKELFSALHDAIESKPRYTTALTPTELSSHFDTARGFKDWFTDDKHESNTAPHNKSITNYRTYITKNYVTQTKLRMKKQLKDNFEDATHSPTLQNAFSQYMMNLNTNNASDTMKHLGTATLPVITKDTRHRIKQAFSKKPDLNYMRYLTSAPFTLSGQEFSLNGEKHTYDMTVNIPDMKTLSMEVKMDDKTYFFSGEEPSAIIDAIRNDTSITEDRTKIHLIYTFIKAMTKKAQEKHLPLVYEDAGHLKALKIEGNDILTLSEDNKKLFSETDFTTSQNWNTLEIGIENILNHFYEVMGKTNTEEKQMVKDKKFYTNITPNKHQFITKMLNFKNFTDFKFGPENKTLNGKQISLAFDHNIRTINIDGKEYTNKNLFKILYDKKNSKSFEGIDKDILARGNKNLIAEASKNKKVEKYPLAVEDPISKEIYLLQNGKFYSVSTANKVKTGQFPSDYPKEMNNYEGVNIGIIKNKDTITNGQKTLMSDEAIDSLLKRSKLTQNFFTLISKRLASFS